VDLKRLVETRRAEIRQACASNGATNVAVFGSVARGDPRPDSDLDILVDLDPSKSLLDHIHLQHELEDLLGVRVDVVTRRGLHPLIRDAVLREAVPV
jgi:predicted nucleotidyltransferase